MENQKNLPEKKFRAGPVSATVWKNQTKNKSGEDVAYNTVSVERSYKDKNDQWQSASSFRTNDLPKLMLVLNKTYEYLTLKEVEVQDNPIPNEDIVM